MHGKFHRAESLAYEKKKQELLTTIKSSSKAALPKLSLGKGTSNLFRPHIKSNGRDGISIKNFDKVLSVDPVGLTAEVEGMTTYEDFVRETLKYSCLPTVVPELKSITVGGAISGCGIESSSFKFGLVHETVEEMEVLVGDGTVVYCSPDNDRKDLFYGFPNTYGTLGYALKVKVRLIPAKRFVKLKRQKHVDSRSFFSSLKELCSGSRRKGGIDYIEGVIFDHDELFITTGELVDEAPFTSDYRYKNIYYKSIKEKPLDYLAAADYIWRWDPDWFWCSKVFGMQNPFLRSVFGKVLLGSSKYARIMHFFNRHPTLSAFLDIFRGKRESVIQDISIPCENAEKFYDFFRTKIGIKPIWICPTENYAEQPLFPFCPMDPGKLYLDFGFWDSIETSFEEGYYNRQIEDETRRLAGFKSLYSTSYYSEEEFWELYDKGLYVALKKKYDPGFQLGDLYRKCTKKGVKG